MIIKYLKERREEKMWRDLKDFEGSPLYELAVVDWEINRPLNKLRIKFWRRVNMIKKCFDFS